MRLKGKTNLVEYLVTEGKFFAVGGAEAGRFKCEELAPIAFGAVVCVV